MDLSNSSFIVETAQGNVVVNPSSTRTYKNITLVGNGYYDWGRIIAQDLAYVADQLANLSDGGVQQATFDANQFIAQFQASQTQALADHTTNLLNAIDNKIAAKFAVVNSDLTTSLASINAHFNTIEANYKDADTALNLAIRNDLTLAITNKVNVIQGLLDTLNTDFSAFRDDTQLWRSTVQPLISSFSSNFSVFQSNTEADLTGIHSTIIANYDNLNDKINTINNNVVGNNAAVLADAALYTDSKITTLSATVEANRVSSLNTESNLDARVTTTEGEISVLQSLVPSFITTSNTILADSKAYTNTEIAKISGPTGTLTNLTNTVNTLDTTFSDRVHSLIDPKTTSLTDDLNALSLLTNNYITSNNAVVSANNDDMLSKNNDVTSRLSIIENTYPGLWEQYATTKSGAVQTFADGLNTRLTTAEGEIDNLQLTVSSLSNTASGNSSDLSALIPRVTALENTRATTTDVAAADAATLASAKAYTDDKVTTINSSISTGNSNTLTSAKAYTDDKINTLALTIPDKTSTDAALSNINILSSQVNNINNVSIPGLTQELNDLTLNTTKLGTDLRTEYNSKVDSLNSSLISGLNFIKENFVTYDTIYPILKTILGYIINNQITESELDELIDNIMLQYKDSTNEMINSNISGAIFMTASNYNIRLILNKETFPGIVQINLTDGSVSKTLTNFESNNGSHVVPLYSGTSYILTDVAGVVNNSVQFGAGLNIDALVATITYTNEFGFNVSEKFNINLLYRDPSFTFRDLYVNTTSGKLELYLELSGPSSNIITPTAISADGVAIDNTQFTIDQEIVFDNYYSKKIKIILSDANLYNSENTSGRINLISISYDSGLSANFNIPDLLKYSVGGVN